MLVDLLLKKDNPQKGESSEYVLKDAINENRLIVILGAPGSGKTSILKKYEKDYNATTQYITAKKILGRQSPEFAGKPVLLIDAVDEYRSITNDKVFVPTALGEKIKGISAQTKIVITCREMDWFGASDVSALKEEIGTYAAVFRLQPLNVKQKFELAELEQLQDPQEFINKYDKMGFLNNPQMFCMLAEMHKSDSQQKIATKRDLYEFFIKNARERNESYTRNKVNRISAEDLIQYTGYIAYFYIFCNIDVFDEEVIGTICSDRFSIDKIEIVLSTTLFSEKTFIHRTLAEFALANFIKSYKMENDLAIERIKAQFSRNNRIPTSLRGTYAWLCSLTIEQELIEVDPFYQAVYGDNATFTTDYKKMVITNVKEYSRHSPYFMSNWWNRGKIEGFYNSNELDQFLITEFSVALKLKGHYFYFLAEIIDSDVTPGSELTQYLQQILYDEGVPDYYKHHLFPALFVDESNVPFLIQFLEDVISDKVEDKDNRLKHALLNELYPDHIGKDDIVRYIASYKDCNISYSAYYLYKAKFEDQRTIVEQLHQLYCKVNGNEISMDFPALVEMFVEDFFLELISRYEKSYSAKDIFEILKHFKNTFYGTYQHVPIETSKGFETEVLSKDKVDKLCNELFSIYMDELLASVDHFDYLQSPINFQTEFFVYQNPTRYSEILISKLSWNNRDNINVDLLYYAYIVNRDRTIEEMRALGKKYGISEEIERWLNPPSDKSEWQIKLEERQAKLTLEMQKSIADNELFFSNLNDEDLTRHLDALYFISKIVHFENPTKKITQTTFDRLKRVLKNLIYIPPIEFTEFLTIESLAKKTVPGKRIIDHIFCSSCYLNSTDYEQFADNEFHRYLYIICVLNKSFDGHHANWCERFETWNQQVAIQTLKEYIRLLFQKFYPNIKDTLTFYSAKETDINKLKAITSDFFFDGGKAEDSLLAKFLEMFVSSLSVEDLEKLLNIDDIHPNNQKKLEALRCLLLKERDKIDRNNAVLLFHLFGSEHHFSERFHELDSATRLRLADYLITQFDDQESLQSKSGLQSEQDQCAFFLDRYLLALLTEDELKQLLESHRNDIWTKRILHQISIINQKSADALFNPLEIEELKEFILSDSILSAEEFFEDVYIKAHKLKTEIEDNRNNDKKAFYNGETGKHENDCRDIILQRLKDKYGIVLDLTKEMYEGENRTDINVKYRANPKYEVQIECKRNKHPEINTGVKDQLIGKYFSSAVKHGIYLIFNFSKYPFSEEATKKIEIPDDWRSNVRIICINLGFT